MGLDINLANKRFWQLEAIACLIRINGIGRF
jgi:hypothetical protein